MVNAGHVGGTRGSGIVSIAADVLWMSVVRGMRGVEMCEMCMCLARGGMGGDGGWWMRGLGLGFTKHVLDTCLCLRCGGLGGVGGQGAWTRIWRGGWCFVCVRCEYV